MILHPEDSNIAWAGVIGNPWAKHEERGVYKTTDGGLTWKKVLYVNPGTGCADLVLDPRNPNKLVAAMWEHQRWPWFFNSGGKGSGLYISYDGGENWWERTSKDGLPDGTLGRIGLAIAPSRTNIIYALVESKKNGLYKSTDGGDSWSLVSDQGIGGRPFYYADLFVDPINENRLYNVHTMVDVSEDGGKNFKRFIPTDLIHVDNHALWIHPEDPEFIINGNDGGMCISRDRGETWDYPENLPIGQFYHIRVDDEIPYHVSGGMQDNGSWRGPSQVWRRKGIRNLYWNRIGFGDGFDAVPDPKDSRFGYSMLQGGSLLRYDLETGGIQSLKPFVKGGEPLRFNWNAGIAIDPFDQETLYFGSQYLLMSMDKGSSWEKISPDLTTNDPEKQEQSKTGGLSLDNTGAENHTTIITIDPSPLEKGLIWVGTDDGKVQLTRNGGESWTDLSSRMPGLPKGAWVAQINASQHKAGEAFVIVNNYRQGDWTPFLYHTDNYGQSWRNMVDEKDVWGYTLCMVQDPVEPKLLFLGTEFGLYVSINGGKDWTKWTNGYPTVSTMDLAIHPREHDLVIGTFGRAIWILDDIRPLRTLAKEGIQIVREKAVHAFPAPPAYLAHIGEPNGYRSTGHGLFMGENRPYGALLSYYIKEIAEDKKAKASIKIYDGEGTLVRTLQDEPEAGINRLVWEMDMKRVRFPTQSKPKADAAERGGRSVLPGTYKVVVNYQDQESSTDVEVKTDPKLPVSKEEMTAKAKLIDHFGKTINALTQRMDQLREAKSAVENLNKLLKEQGDKHKTLMEDGKALLKQMKELEGLITSTEEVQGISRDPNLLASKLSGASRSLQDILFPLTKVQELQVEYVEMEAQPILKKMDAFLAKEWPAYKQKVESAELSWLPDLNSARD